MTHLGPNFIGNSGGTSFHWGDLGIFRLGGGGYSINSSKSHLTNLKFKKFPCGARVFPTLIHKFYLILITIWTFLNVDTLKYSNASLKTWETWVDFVSCAPALLCVTAGHNRSCYSQLLCISWLQCALLRREEKKRTRAGHRKENWRRLEETRAERKNNLSLDKNVIFSLSLLSFSSALLCFWVLSEGEGSKQHYY